MKVLVACEESQEVCKAFRAKGHEAFSCDIQLCSGGHPEWHILGDVLTILNGNSTFITEDFKMHEIKGTWDLIIAHPPCTFLTCTGNRYFSLSMYGGKALKRIKDREDAISFFMNFVYCDCPRVVIENPIGIMSTRFRKPDQIINPWQFALTEDEETEKRTCLWLRGVKPLIPLWDTKPDIKYVYFPSGKRQTLWYYNTRCLHHSERAKAASKTFPGIAKAMAEQWG